MPLRALSKSFLGNLLALFLLFPACTRNAPDVELPLLAPTSVPLPDSPRSRGEIIVNIDLHGKRVIQDEEYDSDESLKQLLVRCLEQLPNLFVVIRADWRAPHQSVMSVLLLARSAGFSKVEITTCFANDPGKEERLPLLF